MRWFFVCFSNADHVNLFCGVKCKSDFFSSGIELEEALPPKNERKFIVFESCLQEQLHERRGCQEVCMVKMAVTGSAVDVTCSCKSCEHTWHWSSQPKIRQMHVGNLLMSAAILFSGPLASKVLRFLDIFGIQRIARSTHFEHQKKFLHATVHSVWQNEQNKNLQVLRDRGGHLVLAGSDSPGHSAKYGDYNMLECVTKRVVDVQVVQVCIRIVFVFVFAVYYFIS